MASITISNQTITSLERIEFDNDAKEVKVYTTNNESQNFDFKEFMTSYFGPKCKGVRKTKDPNKPKRPKNAYMLFCLEKRQDVQSELGTKQVGDVQKRLGEIWKSMTDDDKATYVEQSAQLSTEYKVAMENYETSNPSEKKTTENIVKKAKLIPVDEETAKELPVAPSGWTGPFVGFLKGCPKTNENKRFQKAFNTFEEAVMKADEFSNDQVGGIVKTSKGYCIRAGSKIIQTPGSNAKNEYCWLFTPSDEPEKTVVETSDNQQNVPEKKKKVKKIKKKASVSSSDGEASN